VLADPEVEDGVYILTDSNFDEFVKGEPFTIVEFYAPWCGHCKKLAPEYSKASMILAKENPPVKLAKVDATVEKSIGERFEIRGYPTIKIFRNGVASEYDGPREANGIVRYVKSKTCPSSMLLDSIEAAETVVKKSDDASAVIYFGSKESSLFSVFSKVADQLREQYRFAHSFIPEVATNLGITGDKIVVFLSQKFSSKLEEMKREFTGSDSSTTENIIEFLNKNGLPLAGEFTSDNSRLYSQKGLPVVKLYVDVDWEKNPKGAVYQLNRLRKVGKNFSDKFSFVLVSKKNFNNEVSDLGLDAVEAPVVIHDLKSNKKYKKEESKFSPEGLQELLQNYLDGKIEAHIKSQPIPDSNDDDVKVVVAKNFDSIVLDTTKDVLLEAYAPWCGHCKQLEPKFNKLGNEMKNYDSVVIAKIDATANELPTAFEVQGFPTIFFVPANNKAKPMKYEGPREVKDFVSFIKKHASLPLAESTSDKDEL